MTLQDILFNKFTPPAAASIRRHYCGGSPEDSKYGLSDKMLETIRASTAARNAKAAQFRAKVRAYVAANPKCTCSQAAQDLGHTCKRITETLLDLLDAGEVTRVAIHTLKRGGPATNFYSVAE